jgi:hypothetical protein
LLDKETKALIQSEKDEISAGRKVLAGVLRELLSEVVRSLEDEKSEFSPASSKDFLFYMSHVVEYCSSLSDILATKEKRHRQRERKAGGAGGSEGQVCSAETVGSLIRVLNREVRAKEFDFGEFQ